MSDQGVEWASYIKDELRHEYAREEALTARGSVRLTSVTAIVTITFGAFTLLKASQIQVTGVALVAVIVGLVFLTLAAIAASFTGVMLLKYDVTTGKTLSAMVKEKWKMSETLARNYVAVFNVRTISTLRPANEVKRKFLLASAWFQTAAIISFVVAAFVVVTR
ncbi:hypothetical protein [Rhodococcus sp. BH5]|uniref:hypothetical protein n=1 Tax=Rhodococcus sp. BH5 TaxID=2871702 RepID=UPI0022CD2CB0|nr:hypothetical protein [Rhodococcus sp. BH5]MCZ9635243.1 hypothetical protein [Rhodococcus sp. BH5]